MNLGPTEWSGSDEKEVELLTQQEYDKLKSPDSNTLYLIEKTGNEVLESVLPYVIGAYEGPSLKWKDDRVLPGGAWKLRTSAADNQWLSVCWSPELSLFVAVSISGLGNRVMTSPDGINWTSRTSAADNQWSSVCWSPELSLFVAVAYSGFGNRVMTGY